MRKVEASVARFSRNDSQDIVQEALLRAVRHGVDCDAEPWLKTVARRIAIDRARAAREVVGLTDADVDASMSSNHGNPEAVLLANETLDLIRKALRAMPARYRDALLTYVEEQETAGVARRLGISNNATWTLLSRARARLRKELHRVGYAAGVFAFRFQRWSENATTAVASVGVAATVALSNAPAPVQDVTPPRIAAPIEAPAPARAPVAVPPPLQTAKPRPSSEPAPPAIEDALPAETPNAQTVARYEVHSCTPLPELGVEVEIVEEQRSLLGELLQIVPEPLRVIDQPDC